MNDPEKSRGQQDAGHARSREHRHSCLCASGPSGKTTAPKTAALLAFGLLLAASFVPVLLSGCGYMVGSPHQAEIRSVHVPTFTSDSFRRGVEIQLTEAVQKEIQNRTPFRLVKEPYADTRLTGHITEVRKKRLGETGFDDPRELQLHYSVEATWEDLRTGQILSQQRIPIAPDTVHLLSTADFAPEVGQSLATGTQDAVNRMARQIVDMMETPW